MEYQAYILPKKRDKFFQHFLSAEAEDRYLSTYAALSTDITTNNRFFNIAIKDFAIPVDKIKRSQDFYLINFLRVKENGNFYYYNITGVIKQTQELIIYSVELDEYHTYFNNHGKDYDFEGRLKFSNTNYIEDAQKIYLQPAKSTKNERVIGADWAGGFIGIGCVKWNRGGFGIIVTDPQEVVEGAINYIFSLLKDGEVTLIVGPNSENPQQTTEKFEILSGYIVPKILIEPYYKDLYRYEHGVYKGYSFRETGIQTFNIPIQDYRTAVVEFGTFSSRINVGVNGKNIKANIELTANDLSSDIDISLTIGTQKISLTNDFGITLAVSQFTSYISSNKISIALNALSAVGGLAAGVVTGNVVSMIGSAKAGIDVGNEIYQQSQKQSTTYGSGNAALTYGKLLSAFGMWMYSPENENYLISMRSLYGGDCQNVNVYFADIKAIDKGFGVIFYEFTKINSNYPQVNRIAPLLLGGIEIQYIE